MISLRRDFDEITVRGRLTAPRVNQVTRNNADGERETVTVANLTVVVNRSIRNTDGTYRESPQYYELSVWGEQADRYLEKNMFAKGVSVMVRGMPAWETYAKGDGSTGVRVKIEAPPGGRLEVFLGERPASASASETSEQAEDVDEEEEVEMPRQNSVKKPTRSNLGNGNKERRLR